MDLINKIGSTAFVIAAYRVQEESAEHPLFKDKYAKFFVNEDIMQKAKAFYYVIPEAREMVRCRTKFFDDKVDKYIEKGVEQVVLLGSGFDMRACKHSGVDFYDVDQRAVLKFKEKVIKGNNIDYTAKFVPCNYIEKNVISKLIEKGLDVSKSTLLVWEGNTQYIPLNKIFGFLNKLKDKLNKFYITFDYFDDTVISRESGIQSVIGAAEFFEKMGAPWVTGFSDMSLIEKETGLKLLENITMESLTKKYDPDGSQNNMEIFQLYSVCTLSNF